MDLCVQANCWWKSEKSIKLVTAFWLSWKIERKSVSILDSETNTEVISKCLSKLQVRQTALSFTVEMSCTHYLKN